MDAVAESSGVGQSMLSSASSMLCDSVSRARAERVRLATASEVVIGCEDEEPDDSSKERLGEREMRMDTRAVSEWDEAVAVDGGEDEVEAIVGKMICGDGEREYGNGIWEGVNGGSASGGLRWDLCLDGFAGEVTFALDLACGFFFSEDIAIGDEGSSSMQGNPTYGPRKFRIDEKCS